MTERIAYWSLSFFICMESKINHFSKKDPMDSVYLKAGNQEGEVKERKIICLTTKYVSVYIETAKYAFR